MCILQYQWKIIRDSYCFHLSWFFKYEVGTYWKSWHAYRSWYPDFVTLQETTMNLSLYYVKQFDEILSLDYDVSLKKKSFSIDCTNKNQIGNVAQSESLHAIWRSLLISKFIQNCFDIPFYQPFLTKKTVFIKIVVNVTPFQPTPASDI